MIDQVPRVSVWAKMGASLVMLLYALASAALFAFGLDQSALFVCGLLTVFLSTLAFLYLRGIRTENDCVMIPFAVAELIARVLLGFVVGATWVVYLLAVFELIVIPSPSVAIGATIFFGIWIKLYLIFFDGYRAVKKLNDRKRMEQEPSESYYMRITTSRPSKI